MIDGRQHPLELLVAHHKRSVNRPDGNDTVLISKAVFRDRDHAHRPRKILIDP